MVTHWCDNGHNEAPMLRIHMITNNTMIALEKESSKFFEPVHNFWKKILMKNQSVYCIAKPILSFMGGL